MNTKGYLYETHMHTSESSACAKCSAAEMVQAYKAAGYTGIITTDHFYNGNTAVSRTLPWTDWVNRFCLSYEKAKAEGDKIGLQVFFGWEAGYHGTEFLIYGLDKEWLLLHPEIKDATVEEQYALVHKGGGMVSHAHPFREEVYIPQIRLYPEYVDAVEGVNAMHSSRNSNSHKNPKFNERALAYGTEHNLPFTAGGDQHTTCMIGGGMLFERKLSDIQDFIRAVLNREYRMLLDGTEVADEKG